MFNFNNKNNKNIFIINYLRITMSKKLYYTPNITTHLEGKNSELIFPTLIKFTQCRTDKHSSTLTKAIFFSTLMINNSSTSSYAIEMIARI